MVGLLFASTMAFSQIVTAASYFNDVSDYYAGLYTYRCDISVDSDGRQMSGSLAYSRPQLIRISFNRQGGQILIFDTSPADNHRGYSGRRIHYSARSESFQALLHHCL